MMIAKQVKVGSTGPSIVFQENSGRSGISVYVYDGVGDLTGIIQLSHEDWRDLTIQLNKMESHTHFDLLRGA